MACASSVDRVPAFTWKPLEIAAVVIGFLMFWPIGVALLFWKFWKEGRGSVPFSFDFSQWRPAAAGNSAFETDKRETLERLERERRKLQDEEREFAEFLRELRRAKDQEEFDRFMASRRGGTV
jgi:hypothetical protein